MTQVIKSISEWRRFRAELPQSASLGFVPTLGGLHDGHFGLVRRALAENDCAAVSVFLNRTQFNQRQDYENYPANFDEDVAALRALGVDAVLAPAHEDMYPDSYRYKVTEAELSAVLEGAHRPGHFDGVLTVVLKLLNLVSPTRAYFGEKDWQQLQLVKGMADAFFLPVEIVACETARGPGGLALSSRNRRLSADGLRRAERFNQILNTAATCDDARRELETAGFAVEYVAERDGRRLGAVVVEGVRLIDNLPANSLDPSLT